MENKTWDEQMIEQAREDISLFGNRMLSIPAIPSKTMDEQIDELEALVIKEGNLVDCPLRHVFTPGLYTRTILMEEGALVTSMVHKEEHQYIISKGTALVKIGDGEWQSLSAPYVGVTQAGTRRVLYIESTCIWTSIHRTDIQPINDSKEAFDLAVDAVEEEIYIKRENPLLGGFLKGNKIIKTIEKWPDGQAQQ